MVSSIPVYTKCFDFTITSPRIIIGWHNVPIVLFHKEALSWNDGMGLEGVAVWIWEEDLCVCVNVCVLDSHAAS